MKSRKGLSSVVGMVFAIIALSSVLVYVNYSLNTLDQYNQAVLSKNQQMLNMVNENFKVTNVALVGGKMNVTVTNTGNLPINFTKIWIQNVTQTKNGFDWTKGYVFTNNFVVPGNTLTNIGQQIPTTINPTYAYNIKLVTSRGNSQQFGLNSASSAPLNIQLMFLPHTVSTGFTSELLLVVINNSTNTLTNISPSSLPNPTYGAGNGGNLVCNTGLVNPPSYNTLAPGSAAFFTWDITTTAGNAGDTCTYNLTQPLQNGYSQNVSPPLPLTITSVSLASTTYAQNSGVITNDYTAFRWTEGNTWNPDWSFPGCTTVDFKVTVTNNNQTAGGYKLWLSKNSQIFFMPTTIPSNAKIDPSTYYLVNSVTLSPLGITGYADNSIGIPNQGGVYTLSFGADSPGDNNQASNTCGNGSPPFGLQTGTAYYGSIVLYGKFTKNSGDNTGGNYAQAIPFLAVMAK